MCCKSNISLPVSSSSEKGWVTKLFWLAEFNGMVRRSAITSKMLAYTKVKGNIGILRIYIMVNLNLSTN